MNEDLFIRKLELYLGEDFNLFSKNRIKGFLTEYKESLTLVVIKEKAPKNYTNYKKHITRDILLDNAAMLCKVYKVDLDKFLKTPEKRSASHKITELRKKFCKTTLEQYLCNSNVLAEFFQVDHSTISYYIHERKKYKIITRNLCKL